MPFDLLYCCVNFVSNNNNGFNNKKGFLLVLYILKKVTLLCNIVSWLDLGNKTFWIVFKRKTSMILVEFGVILQ